MVDVMTKGGLIAQTALGLLGYRHWCLRWLFQLRS